MATRWQRGSLVPRRCPPASPSPRVAPPPHPVAHLRRPPDTDKHRSPLPLSTHQPQAAGRRRRFWASDGLGAVGAGAGPGLSRWAGGDGWWWWVGGGWWWWVGGGWGGAEGAGRLATPGMSKNTRSIDTRRCMSRAGQLLRGTSDRHVAPCRTPPAAGAPPPLAVDGAADAAACPRLPPARPLAHPPPIPANNAPPLLQAPAPGCLWRSRSGCPWLRWGRTRTTWRRRRRLGKTTSSATFRDSAETPQLLVSSSRCATLIRARLDGATHVKAASALHRCTV